MSKRKKQSLKDLIQNQAQNPNPLNPIFAPSSFNLTKRSNRNQVSMPKRMNTPKRLFTGKGYSRAQQ